MPAMASSNLLLALQLLAPKRHWATARPLLVAQAMPGSELLVLTHSQHLTKASQGPTAAGTMLLKPQGLLMSSKHLRLARPVAMAQAALELLTCRCADQP